ncbi:CdaR family protein [uncultured Algibacter sp.]|uniref:CdaR family protein n=1 Tax=uncultured Algibacter sp. TaxID=298659 RepID=UPI0026116DD2|nr:CdaR family protein [uncultured Algibacter sp.]
MEKLRADILTSFKNRKINVFILFLFFAFVILMFTKLSKEYTNTIAFDVEKLNIPQENIILNDSTKINITLKTHGFRWLKYYFSKPKIKIDFNEDVHKKEGVFVWNKSKAYLNNIQFDKAVEILNISPDPITFRYGVNMVKTVPVLFNTDVSFSPGFSTTSAIISEPDSVTVVGPNILVSEIESLELEDVTFKDIKSDILEKVNIKLPQNVSDLKFSTNQVVLKAKVEKFTEGTLKIPVSIINAPKNTNLKYFPRMVSVSYYVSLSNFNAIKANDFKVVCDFNKTNENQSFLIPELVKTPGLVQHSKISQQRIEFIITK